MASSGRKCLTQFQVCRSLRPLKRLNPSPGLAPPDEADSSTDTDSSLTYVMGQRDLDDLDDLESESSGDRAQASFLDSSPTEAWDILEEKDCRTAIEVL